MNEIEFDDLLEGFESSDKYSFTEEEAKNIIKDLDKDISDEISDNNYKLELSVDSAFSDMTPITTNFI